MPQFQLKRDDGARRRPDLGILYGCQIVAVEVELHAKSPARLEAILKAYRRKIRDGEMSSVAYVVDKPYVDRLVRRHIEKAGMEHLVSISQLDDIINRVRTPIDPEQIA